LADRRAGGLLTIRLPHLRGADRWARHRITGSSDRGEVAHLCAPEPAVGNVALLPAQGGGRVGR